MFGFVFPLLWKSWCIRKRHYVVTAFELLSPIGLFMLMLYLKSSLPEGHDTYVKNTTFTSDTKNSLLTAPSDLNKESIEIAYAPANDSRVVDIMKQVNRTLLGNNYYVSLIPAESEAEVASIFFDKYGNESIHHFGHLIYGIIFAANLSYTLRPLSTSFSTNLLFPPFSTPGPGSIFNVYFSEGFVMLQIAINDAICSISNISTSIDFELTEFPYPAYHMNSQFKQFYSSIIPLISMFAYYVMVPNLISNVIHEKNSGSREWMGMVGIPKIIILISWVLHTLPLYLVTNIICCGILVANTFGSPILAATNLIFVWMILFLFCTSTVVFLLAVTSFINNPNVAVIFGSFMWILPSVAFNFQDISTMAYALKVFSCFFPTCALKWAFTAFSGYEANHETISFSNLYNHASGPNEVPLGIVLLFMFGSIFLYSLLFLYIDSVKPGSYGRARPWYFPISSIYKTFSKKSYMDGPTLIKRKNTFEDVQSLPVGLGFQGIKKHFGNVVAVDDVTIDIYKGQITALLGHNGAGKTTLINIVTGMFSPTKGKIWREGQNVFDDFSNFQTKLGLCPQHDLLFPYLNVIEHVMFFGMLRGLSWKEAKKDSTDLLKFFGISDKANSLTKKLSGGMKRKLSLSVSLVGKPEILILDEPTSGMDPESRRDTWNKLLALRGDRTIILTTHYMEEADVLGDMIAIMDHGTIKCYGTSLFLKKQYGSGYKVTVPLEDQELVSDIVKSFVPEVSAPSVSGPHISYSLPLEKSEVFSDLFSSLESRLPKSSRISVACTTLDDVFLKVANKASDEVDNALGDDEILLPDSNKTDDVHSSSEALTPKPITGFPLFWNRLSALFMKKLLFNYHRWASWAFLTIVYPFVLFIIPITLSSNILKKDSVDPLLAMDLSIYSGSNVVVSPSTPNLEKLTASFKNIVKQQKSNILPLANATSIVEDLLNIGTESLSKYRFSYIIAANVSASVPNFYYSSIALHSPAVAINMLYKSWIAAATGKDTLNTFNHPFNFQEGLCNSSMVEILQYAIPSIWLFTAPFALAVISFSFSRLHHDERLSSGKLLQLMTGTSPVLYWCSAYLCDLFLLLISSLLIILWTYFFDSVHLFSSFYDYSIFFMILLVSCSGNVWFGYLTSYFLRTFSRLFSVNMFFAFMIGQVAYFILYLFQSFGSSGSAANIFHHIFMFYPTYCSTALIFKFIKNLAVFYGKLKCFKDIGLPVERPALFTWDNDGINQELVYIVCDCLLIALIIFLTDYGVLGKISNYIFNLWAGDIDQAGTSFDADVENEKSKAEEAMSQMRASQSSIIVDSLGKKYSRKVTAVKNISFVIPKGECFGLLGVNGAGKSTTFKMLTGDLLPTAGQAVLFGDSLRDNKLKYQSHIGYCPQTDAIIDALTGKEMLKLYASLRGVNASVIERTISFWISEFGMQSVCNRKCETYSGGNKRKLSTAISLIGDPQVVFLDEPTTGVDPVARRKFWAILSNLQKRGCTIILTSHSMDECETVCDRLTIMVKGEMKCIGNIQRLKDIYGQGFTIIVQLGLHSAEQLVSLKSAFVEIFSSHAILRDEHIGLLHYHIDSPSYKWSQLFSTMESLKENHLIIKEYAISETTLEQIFLHFAKV